MQNSGQGKGCAAAHVMSREVSDVTAARDLPSLVAASSSSWLLLHESKVGLRLTRHTSSIHHY